MSPARSAKIRVLIVDDVAAARQAVRAMLEEDPAIAIAGEAANGEEAVAAAGRLRPDVITMDVLMPVMDGYAATARIMAERPTPIIAVTSLPLEDGSVLERMLSAGAIDVVRKAFARDPEKWARMRAELLSRVRAAARARVASPAAGSQPAASPGSPPRVDARPEVIVIAASTGGPAALQAVLGGLSPKMPCPVLVVQHIAADFTAWLASWLAGCSPLPVHVAQDGESALAGHIYLAPDDRHLLVTARHTLRLNQALPVQSLRPSADVLFRSASQAFGAGVIAVVLTGMGSDGAQGARGIKDAGGTVLVQDAATCAIFGMPQAVIAAGAADAVLPLPAIAGRLRALCGLKEPA